MKSFKKWFDKHRFGRRRQRNLDEQARTLQEVEERRRRRAAELHYYPSAPPSFGIDELRLSEDDSDAPPGAPRLELQFSSRTTSLFAQQARLAGVVKRKASREFEAGETNFAEGSSVPAAR